MKDDPHGKIKRSELIDLHKELVSEFRAELESLVARKLLTKKKLEELASGTIRPRGTKAPNASLNTAKLVANVLREQMLCPQSINASADGGVSFYFYGAEQLPGGSHRRYGWLECDNDGDVVLSLCDRLNEASNEFIEVAGTTKDIGDAVRRLRLHTGNAAAEG